MSGPPSVGLLAGGVLGMVALVLVAIGAPSSRPAPAPAPVAEPDPAPGVAGGGFTLVSTAIDLPDDTQTFPAGAAGNVLTAHCTACHSAAMVLNQPLLTPEQWKATVTKMREAYKAPIADGDVPAILDALTGPGGVQGRLSSASPPRLSSPAATR